MVGARHLMMSSSMPPAVVTTTSTMRCCTRKRIVSRSPELTRLLVYARKILHLCSGAHRVSASQIDTGPRVCLLSTLPLGCYPRRNLEVEGQPKGSSHPLESSLDVTNGKKRVQAS